MKKGGLSTAGLATVAGAIVYDVFFVFCNSIFYGLVLHKTKNAYASVISHFIANFTGTLILLYIL